MPRKGCIFLNFRRRPMNEIPRDSLFTKAPHNDKSTAMNTCTIRVAFSRVDNPLTMLPRLARATS